LKDYDVQINPKRSNSCKACGLYLNQFPLLDSKTNADIFWVGLSAVQTDDDDNRHIPLSPSTKSGKLIQDIELSNSMELVFLKTNLVKCLPLNENKIRYPQLLEMNKCYPNLEKEIFKHKPKIVFLLGRQVADFVYKKNSLKLQTFASDYSYKGVYVDDILYVPIHHPSYMLVYKRKYIQDYIKGVRNIIYTTWDLGDNVFAGGFVQ
jgi:uracil-DNA glycosylase